VLVIYESSVIIYSHLQLISCSLHIGLILRPKRDRSRIVGNEWSHLGLSCETRKRPKGDRIATSAASLRGVAAAWSDNTASQPPERRATHAQQFCQQHCHSIVSEHCALTATSRISHTLSLTQPHNNTRPPLYALLQGGGPDAVALAIIRIVEDIANRSKYILRSGNSNNSNSIVQDRNKRAPPHLLVHMPQREHTNTTIRE
jgi:hypothetical protein